MDKIAHHPEELTRLSALEIIEKAGSQGVELLNWIAMRGRFDRSCDKSSRGVSHPDLQYGFGRHVAGERHAADAASQGGVNERVLEPFR